MSDVTYTPLLDGIVLSADTIYPYFIRLNGVDSMSVINAYLDTANLSVEDMTGVNYNLIQRGAQSTAGSVAGTRNLDFFGGTSNTIQGVYDGVGNVEVAPGRRWIPIPGASIQFRLDYPSYILLTWHIGWASDDETLGDALPEYGTMIRLFINGRPADGGYTASPESDSPNVRAVGRGQFKRDAGTYLFLRDRYKSRVWCGHAWVEGKSKGWHSASLRICSHQDVKQARVRARSMKYIAFKRGDT